MSGNNSDSMLEGLDLKEVRGEWELVAAQKGLPSEVERRIEVIQQLLGVRGTDRYGEIQRQSALKLGITVRSLQRLVKSWEEQGVAGLLKHPRSDRGVLKTSVDWQKFIVKTYRDGNRGSKRMSRAQVAVRVKVRALELGVSEYPGRTTVYRILKPYIEKGSSSKRSLGWRGSGLIVSTREGLEIGIEWSNQVWQCDHTQVDVLVVDQTGEILGRPWLTIVVDTYSRCYVESTS